MRKKVLGRQLGRNTKSRIALFRSLSRALILEGKITTTRAKAKAVQPMLEKLVTKVVKGDLASRRAVVAKLDNSKELAKKLFEYQESAQARKSGFTRITLLPSRKGDNAQMAELEWTIQPKAEKPKAKKETNK